MKTFYASILTGIIASLLSVLFIELIKKYKIYRYYRKIVGLYDVFYINGPQVSNELIEFKYVKSHLFKVTSYNNGNEVWISNIVMSSENMMHGEGFYYYNSRVDFGTHNILISPDYSTISVHYENLSRPGGQRGGIIWKRQSI